MIFFDAHLDLAYLAVNRRNMLEADPLRAGGPEQPAAVTLPALNDGRVRFALATIFTERDGKGPEGYADEARAHAVGRAQLEVYLDWDERGLAANNLRKLLQHAFAGGRVRAGMGVSEVVPTSLEEALPRALNEGPGFQLGILMENADPIRSPGELGWWADRGVVAIGLAWAKSSRYATGNSEDPATTSVGLTDLGRELVREMDRLGVVHDLSHLSDRATEDLLAATDKPVMASHSNCRAIIASGLGAPANLQRHLRDETIREIARRGGVIGLNFLSNFLIPGASRDRRATIDEALAHVERICEITGSKKHVGIGSDMDGGISRERLPAGINLPRDMVVLAEALEKRNWSDQEIAGFCFGNWLEFWGRQFTA